MGQLNDETRASAFFRVYGDVAFVQLHNLMGERHTDAVTLYGVLFRSAIEQGEELLFVFCRHAAAVVRHTHYAPAVVERNLHD